MSDPEDFGDRDEFNGYDSRSDDEDRLDEMESSEDEMCNNGPERDSAKFRSRMQLYCEICDAHSSSAQNLQLHFAGARHKKKLEMAGLNSDLTDFIERPKNIEIWKTLVKCLLCKVIVMGCDCLIHSKCEDHTTKLASMSKRNQDFYNDINNCFKPVEMDPFAAVNETSSFSCEMCGIELSNEEHLEYHLKGKRHQKKARWMFISDRDTNPRDSFRQVWCGVCRVFVNSLKELEVHFLGKHHVKMLKRAGVKWKVLVDVYGEDTVGMPMPVVASGRGKVHELTSLKRERSSSGHRGHRRSVSTSPDRSRSRHLSRDDHGGERRGREVTERKVVDHSVVRRNPSPHYSTNNHSHSIKEERSYRSRSRSRFPQRKGERPMSRNHSMDEEDGEEDCKPPPQLKHLRWEEKYTSIPEYNTRHPKLLREGRKKTLGRVIYQKPRLAVGDFVLEIGKDDPRFSEMEERARASTMEREKEERERERESRERGRGRERRGFGKRDSFQPRVRNGGYRSHSDSRNSRRPSSYDSDRRRRY